MVPSERCDALVEFLSTFVPVKPLSAVHEGGIFRRVHRNIDDTALENGGGDRKEQGDEDTPLV